MPHQDTPKIIYELDAIKEALGLINQHLEHLEKKVITVSSSALPQMLQVVVDTAIHEKITPSFEAIKLQLERDQHRLGNKKPLKKSVRHDMALHVCVFLSCILGCIFGCIVTHSMMPAKMISSSTVPTLYYGELLKAAWPHLSKTEKKRLYGLSSKKP